MQGCEAGATRQPLLLRALSSLPEPPIQNTFLPFVIAYKQTIEPQIYLRYYRLSPRTAFLESRPFSLTFHGHSRHFSSIFSTAPPKSLRFPPLKGNPSPVTEQHNPGLCFGSAQGCGNPSPELPLGTSPSRLALGFSPASYTLSQLLFSSFPLSSLLRLSEPPLSCSQSRSLSPLPPSLRAALSPFPPSPQLALYPSAPLSARACFALCSRFSLSSRLSPSAALRPLPLSAACTALARPPPSSPPLGSGPAPSYCTAPRAAARNLRPDRFAARRSLPPSECSARRKCCSCGASRAVRCAWFGSITSGATCRAAARCAGPAVRAVSGLRGRAGPGRAGRRGLLCEGAAVAVRSVLGQSRVRSLG